MQWSEARSLAAGLPAVRQRVLRPLLQGQQRRGAHSLAAGLPAAGLRARGCLAGARLPPLRASPRKAPHGVSAAGKGWPVRASHCRGRVRERLRVVWR